MARFGENNKGNNVDHKSINTKSIQLYNEDGFDPSTLALGFWNSYFSFRIFPALPEKDRTTDSRFDYDKGVNCVIPVDKMTLLLRKLKKDVIPAIEEGVTTNVSKAVRYKNTMLEVGNGVKFTGKINPYIAIYKDLDENTLIPEVEIAFEIPSSDVITSYDSRTGTVEVEKDYGGLYMLEAYFDAGIKGLTNANGHAVRDVHKFIINRVIEDLGMIKDNLGIESKRKDTFSGGRSISTQNYSDNRVPTEKNGLRTEPMSVDNFTDI